MCFHATTIWPCLHNQSQDNTGMCRQPVSPRRNMKTYWTVQPTVDTIDTHYQSTWTWQVKPCRNVLRDELHQESFERHGVILRYQKKKYHKTWVSVLRASRNVGSLVAFSWLNFDSPGIFIVSSFLLSFENFECIFEFWFIPKNYLWDKL